MTVIAGTTVFAAIPSFVAAIVLISVFAVKLGWFPALGAGDRRASTGSGTSRCPAIALALSALAIVARVTRVSVREEMGARARADGDQPRAAVGTSSCAATCCATRRSRSPR